jgi:hypothetical protein
LHDNNSEIKLLDDDEYFDLLDLTINEVFNFNNAQNQIVHVEWDDAPCPKVELPRALQEQEEEKVPNNIGDVLKNDKKVLKRGAATQDDMLANVDNESSDSIVILQS